tara:strand:+ start:175 stop:489 length:315 start_codon:yes stop_codon:yes gene_type:complete
VNVYYSLIHFKSFRVSPTNKLIIWDFLVYSWRKPSIASLAMEMALMKKSVETVMKMGTVKMSLVRHARVQAKLKDFGVTRTVQSVMVMVISKTNAIVMVAMMDT